MVQDDISVYVDTLHSTVLLITQHLLVNRSVFCLVSI